MYHGQERKGKIFVIFVKSILKKTKKNVILQKSLVLIPRSTSSPSWGNASCSVVSANAGIVTCHCQLPVEVIVVERDINITVCTSNIQFLYE